MTDLRHADSSNPPTAKPGVSWASRVGLQLPPEATATRLNRVMLFRSLNYVRIIKFLKKFEMHTLLPYELINVQLKGPSDKSHSMFTILTSSHSASCCYRPACRTVVLKFRYVSSKKSKSYDIQNHTEFSQNSLRGKSSQGHKKLGLDISWVSGKT